MNWFSHIGKQASRLASLELFRYIGPGFFVTVGFIGFVSLISLAFVFEIWLADVSWVRTFAGWVTPSFPVGALPVIMGVLFTMQLLCYWQKNSVISSVSLRLRGFNAFLEFHESRPV